MKRCTVAVPTTTPVLLLRARAVPVAEESSVRLLPLSSRLPAPPTPTAADTATGLESVTLPAVLMARLATVAGRPLPVTAALVL